MGLSNRLYRLTDTALRAIGQRPELPASAEFNLPADQELTLPITSPIEKAFFNKEGRACMKWHQYLEAYERHFSPWRGKKFFMLEIGVMRGGSLEMWREYFGSDATLVGIDINPECAANVDEPNKVRIGSQDDPVFLRSVLDEFGTPDIILDDGSHVGRHQRTSFEVLFPKLRDGGLYVIEDTHTAYWPDYEGGFRRPGTAIEFTKAAIDDMHAWYHNRPTSTPARDEIPSIHIYDSVVIFEKRKRPKPLALSSRSKVVQSIT